MRLFEHSYHVYHLIKKQEKRILLFLLSLSVVLMSGCTDNKAKSYTTHLIGYFDTVITIKGYCDREKTFDEYVQIAEDQFKQLHQLFDRYQTYDGVNNIRTINQQAGIKPVPVSEILINCLKAALDWQSQTPAGVNIALGPVLDIWHDYRTQGIENPGSARIPPLSDLKEAASYADSQLIEIDIEKQTVYLPDARMSLDLGAMAKGYATEMVVQTLKNANWTSFAISSGGNVRTVGSPEGGARTHWAIGIEDPVQALESDQVELVDTVFLQEGSVVTSGDYQRYYTVDNKRYHHIIDPHTLMPADYFSSVTIVTENSGWADYLSTLFFVMPYDEGQAFASTLTDVDVLWVMTDGTIEATDGMAERLKSNGAKPD